MESIEDKHNLCRTEGARVGQAYQARSKAAAEREAYLLAIPSKGEDVTTRCWHRGTILAASGPEIPARAVP